MTTGQLITHTDLTFLGHIDLRHLQNAVGQLVTNRDGKLLALQFCIKQLILLHEVDDQLGNQLVLVLVVGPVTDLDVTIFQVLQGSHGKLAALGDDLRSGIVLDTLRGLTLRQFDELVDQDILQVANLSFILLVNLGQRDLILLLRLAVLDGAGKHLLVDDDTCQRRIGLE